MKIRVVLSGRSYHLTEKIPEELSLPDGAHVDAALEAVAQLLGEDQSLPRSCLVVISGNHLGTVESHASYDLREGDELVLITPVAGG